MQRYLDEGKSNSEIARLEHVTEGAVRYSIKTGVLKKRFFSSNPYLQEAIEPNAVSPKHTGHWV
jgi:hypothetical protein